MEIQPAASLFTPLHRLLMVLCAPYVLLSDRVALSRLCCFRLPLSAPKLI